MSSKEGLGSQTSSEEPKKESFFAKAYREWMSMFPDKSPGHGTKLVKEFITSEIFTIFHCEGCNNDTRHDFYWKDGGKEFDCWMCRWCSHRDYTF